jgi:hypothetical protein
MSFLLDFLWADLVIALVLNALLWLWVWLVPVKVIRVSRLWKSGALGMALPGVIFLTPGGDSPRVIAHEMVHQKQFRRYSPLGTSLLLAFYYGLNLIRLRRTLGRWPSFWELWAVNPLEIEAGI